MAQLQEKEKNIVRDSLLLLKGNITKQHLRDVSNLPRNGKAVANSSSEAAEQMIISRLRDIDRIIEQCTLSSQNITTLTQSKPNPDTKAAKPCQSTLKDEEPYINPFTGLFVYPPSKDAPGPSKARSPEPAPKQGAIKSAVLLDNDNNTRYRNSLVTLAAANVSDLELSDTQSITSLQSPLTVQAYDGSRSSTPPTDDVPAGMRSDDLESILSDFDNYFNRVPEPSSQSRPHKNLQQIPARTNIGPETASSSEASRFDYKVVGETARSSPQFHNVPSILPMLPKAQNSEEMPLQQYKDQASKESSVSIARTFSRHEWTGAQQIKDDEALALTLFQEDTQQDTGYNTDFKLALELAGDVPQDWHQFQGIQQDISSQDQQEWEAIESEIHRQDQEELNRATSQIQAIQDEWNRDWEDTVRVQQMFAQQMVEQEHQKELAATLKEMRRLQEMFQAEEDRQIEADRRLAESLAEDTDLNHPTRQANSNNPYRENMSPSLPTTAQHNPFRSHTDLPPPYVQLEEYDVFLDSLRTRRTESASRGGLVPQTPNVSAISAPMSPLSFTENGSSRNADESGHVNQRSLPDPIVNDPNDAFQQAQRTHEQSQSEWQAQLQKNEQAARAIQQELKALEAQARRDQEVAQQMRRRQQQEEERQQREREQRLRLEERQRQEAERQRQAEEAIRRKRMIDCAVCGDAYEPNDVYLFPCKHAYCRECLTQSLDNALKSKAAFRCCKNRVDLQVAGRLLTTDLVTRYSGLLQELDTPNPTYCSNLRCSSFIPSSYVKAGTATCPKCQTPTCSSCKKASHAGVCKQDKDGQALLALGKSKHWQKCPHCGNMVERQSGCLHMSCRCGSSFCYNCGKTKCLGVCQRNF